ncbi:MAG: hypothetical protein EA349_01335, partial [Halomonadaceae bacterium]
MTQSIDPLLNNALWITWEKQRRNHSMSRLLGVPLYELISHRGRLNRYFTLSWQTLRLIKQKKPATVFAQNPSIVLSLLVVIASRPLNFRVVIDEHNTGLFPQEGRSRLLGAVARYIVRNADQVIVTTQGLQRVCEQWGGRALVMPDPLPEFKDSLLNQSRHFRDTTPPQPFRALFICTWAADEPYREVIEAMKHFSPKQLQLSITGNPGSKINNLSIPENVTVMGFLPEEDYLRALVKCHFVVVLTTREDCLNCGAYEAVTMEKPGLLSDTQALKTYFSEGFRFCHTDTKSIVAGIDQLMAQYVRLWRDIAWLKRKLS